MLRERNQNAYLQRYNAYKANRKYIPLARWANQRHLFHAMNYTEFLKKCKDEIGGKRATDPRWRHPLSAEATPQRTD